MKKVISVIGVIAVALGLMAGCGGAKDDDKLVIGYTIYEPMNFED